MSATGYAGMLNLQKLTPELIAPRDLYAATPAAFRLRVHNGKRRFPSFLIKVDCQGSSALIPVVPPGATAEQIIALTFPRRGYAEAGTIRLSSPFPVGFFTRFWSFSLTARFLVYPHPVPARLPAGERGAAGLASDLTRRLGGGGDLERITAYSGAEPLRQVHWKHFARSDELMVKEYGGLTAPTLELDLAGIPGQGLEERISRAAWLIRAFAFRRPVSLKAGRSVVPPGIGRRHAARMLKELALHDPD